MMLGCCLLWWWWLCTLGLFCEKNTIGTWLRIWCRSARGFLVCSLFCTSSKISEQRCMSCCVTDGNTFSVSENRMQTPTTSFLGKFWSQMDWFEILNPQNPGSILVRQPTNQTGKIQRYLPKFEGTNLSKPKNEGQKSSCDDDPCRLSQSINHHHHLKSFIRRRFARIELICITTRRHRHPCTRV